MLRGAEGGDIPLGASEVAGAASLCSLWTYFSEPDCESPQQGGQAGLGWRPCMAHVHLDLTADAISRMLYCGYLVSGWVF